MPKSKTTKTALKLIVTTLGAAWLAACSTDAQKADIGTSQAPDAINSVQSAYDQAVKNDQEILDQKDMEQALSCLNKAKKDQSKGSKTSDVTDNLQYSQGFLNKSNAVSEARRPQMEMILNARHAALTAGARESGATREDFANADSNVQDKIEDFTTTKRDVASYTNAQTAYLNLELVAMKAKKLDSAKANIMEAQKLTGKTAITMSRAQKSLENADNVISTDRHNNELIAPAVAKANQDSKFALEVAQTVKQKSVSEQVAIDFVNTKSANASLTKDLQKNQSDLKIGESKLSKTESERADLARDKRLNDELEASRASFAAADAETFIQGGKLVIRMKNLDFPIGKSDLPGKSLPALAKVKNVITDLNSKDVVVEGHTDSTGSGAMNKELSQNRASAVATYFKTDIQGLNVDSKGYGADKPIANNKTKKGRAQNRRVDVVITPGSAPSADANPTSSM